MQNEYNLLLERSYSGKLISITHCYTAAEINNEVAKTLKSKNKNNRTYEVRAYKTRKEQSVDSATLAETARFQMGYKS
jgi:adenylyl- and sulfurtransferase ThiI